MKVHESMNLVELNDSEENALESVSLLDERQMQEQGILGLQIRAVHHKGKDGHKVIVDHKGVIDDAILETVLYSLVKSVGVDNVKKAFEEAIDSVLMEGDVGAVEQVHTVQ